MRSVGTVISKSFENGLRRFQHDLDKSVLKDCAGLVVDDYGLSEPQFNLIDIKTIVDAGIQVQFPFPQFFHLTAVDLVFTASAVYRVGDGFSFTRLGFNGIKPGGKWQVADLGLGWIATNGVCLVMDLAGAGDYRVIDRQVNSLVYHEGRLIMGGFDKFFSNNWLEWLEKNSGDTSRQDMQDMVYWTSVGAMDLDWFFSNTLPDDEMIRDMLEQGTMGFVPSRGHIVRIELYSDGVIVGTEKGVAYMTAIVDPSPSYGVLHVFHTGVKTLGGSRSEQVFIDKTGTLWHFSSNGLKRLGFKEYLTADDFVVLKSDSDEQFYICDGSYTYVLHNGRMCRLYERVTSVFNEYIFAIYTDVKQ